MIEKILMPKRHDGKRPPNPVRWACGYGHVHPSRRHAAKCVARERNRTAVRAPQVGDRVRVVSPAPCWQGRDWRGVIGKLLDDGRFYVRIDGITFVLSREDFEVLR